MSNFIVGLTGGIGSGKSAVAKQFNALGIEVIDADQIAREVVAANSPALTQIQQHFGDSVIQSNGELDRRALRELVFTHPEHKQWLDNLLHPLIRQKMFSACEQAQSPYVILEVPLLIEGGLYKLVNRTLVVDVSESLQLARAAARDDASEAQIKAIMAAQASRQQRLDHADDVIDNNGELSRLTEQVVDLNRRYLAMISSETSM